jgi:hypothetical protein
MKAARAQDSWMSDETGPEPDQDFAPTRRRLLMLGAVGASAVVTIRPALASTAGSVLNCEIPVPDPARAGNWIDANGHLVAPNTAGAFPPAMRPLTGDQVRQNMQAGRSYPGASYDQSRAYTAYIRRLQHGTSGFTCYASLQMPRG